VAFKTFKKEDEDKSVWDSASPTTQQQVKAALLEGYEKETHVAVRNKICDTIADVARYCEEQNSLHLLMRNNLQIGPWGELLTPLFHSTKSPQPEHRESAFRVFASLPTLVDDSHIELLKSVFLEGLQDQAPEVRDFSFVTHKIGPPFSFQSSLRVLCPIQSISTLKDGSFS